MYVYLDHKGHLPIQDCTRILDQHIDHVRIYLDTVVWLKGECNLT